jgi:glyoxylase-like metal-dependent hydrolase (beta-lactamase superfamily II)
MSSWTRTWGGGLVVAAVLALGLQVGVAAQRGQAPGAPPDTSKGGPLAPDKPIAKAHNDAAKALAAVDDNPLIQWAYRVWCETGYRHQAGADPAPNFANPDDWVDAKGIMTERMAKPSPGKFMDNAWYVGNEHTGAVIVRVPEGLLLFDAMNSPEVIKTQILPQMQKFGLDPTQIKYVFMGHQHGDHIGGANYIRQEFAPGAQFVMGAPDANAVAASRAGIMTGQVAGRGRGAAPVQLTADQQRDRLLLFPDRVDIKVEETPGLKTGMREIKIGPSTTVVAVLNPGHTIGQMSVIVPVTWQGQPHKLVVFSGNDQITAARQYATSFGYIGNIARAYSADAWVNTHGYQSHQYQWFRKVDADPRSRNPFLMGVDGVDRMFTIMSECHKALEQRMIDKTWTRM